MDILLGLFGLARVLVGFGEGICRTSGGQQCFFDERRNVLRCFGRGPGGSDSTRL